MSEEISLADAGIREIQRLRGLLRQAEARETYEQQQTSYRELEGLYAAMTERAHQAEAERDQLKAALDEVVGRELAREAESGASDDVTRSAVARGKPISAKRAAALLAELDAARRVIAAARQIDTSRDDGPDELGAALDAYDETPA